MAAENWLILVRGVIYMCFEHSAICWLIFLAQFFIFIYLLLRTKSTSHLKRDYKEILSRTTCRNTYCAIKIWLKAHTSTRSLQLVPRSYKTTHSYIKYLLILCNKSVQVCEPIIWQPQTAFMPNLHWQLIDFTITH